jgi:hypothetical protein
VTATALADGGPLAIPFASAFANDHDTEVRTVLGSSANRVGDALRVVGDLRNQYDVRTPSKSRAQRDPTSVASITSKSITRSCASAVVCSVSIAHVAVSSAVSKPNV